MASTEPNTTWARQWGDTVLPRTVSAECAERWVITLRSMPCSSTDMPMTPLISLSYSQCTLCKLVFCIIDVSLSVSHSYVWLWLCNSIRCYTRFGLSYMRTIHIRFPMTPTKNRLGYAKHDTPIFAWRFFLCELSLLFLLVLFHFRFTSTHARWEAISYLQVLCVIHLHFH